MKHLYCAIVWRYRGASRYRGAMHTIYSVTVAETKPLILIVIKNYVIKSLVVHTIHLQKLEYSN